MERMALTVIAAKTTKIDTHITKKNWDKIKSALDDLET